MLKNSLAMRSQSVLRNVLLKSPRSSSPHDVIPLLNSRILRPTAPAYIFAPCYP